MKADLKTQKLNCYRTVCRKIIYCEETGELVVPDTMPDAASILMAEGSALLRTKDTMPGKIQVGGLCRVNVLYLQENENVPESVEQDISFTITKEEKSVDDRSKMAATAELEKCEVKILNSRKLLIKVRIRIRLVLWNSEEKEWACGVEPQEGLQVCSERISICPVTEITERSFKLNETLSLPAGRETVGRLLCGRTTLKTEDTDIVGKKLIVRGSGKLTVIYRTTGNALSAADLLFPWSLILEIEASENERRAEVWLTLTGVRFNMANENEVELEIGAAVQTAIRSKNEYYCMTDAYSTVENIMMTTEEMELETTCEAETTEDNLRLKLDSSRPVRGVEDLQVSVHSEETSDKAEIIVRAICSDDNRSCFALFEKMEYVLPSAAENVEINAAEAYANTSPVGIDLRIPLQITKYSVSRRTIRTISGIDSDGSKPENCDYPTVSVVKAERGETVWSIGKAHLVETASIRAMNELEEGKEPKEGDYLLLVR